MKNLIKFKILLLINLLLGIPAIGMQNPQEGSGQQYPQASLGKVVEKARFGKPYYNVTIVIDRPLTQTNRAVVQHFLEKQGLLYGKSSIEGNNTRFDYELTRPQHYYMFGTPGYIKGKPRINNIIEQLNEDLKTPLFPSSPLSLKELSLKKVVEKNQKRELTLEQAKKILPRELYEDLEEEMRY